MHIVPSPENRETITAELSYEQPYRFRLWLAVIEDSAALGMGFRAYLSHVRSSLDLWVRSGIAFLNPKNEPLNLEALTADDLWGFLGKKNQAPHGPKRYIEAAKVAVLDVYMKKKFPNLASTFGAAELGPEFAAVLRSFFSRGLLEEPPTDHIAPWSGIYISGGGVDAQSILRARREGKVFGFVIRAVMLRPSDRSDFCIAHKVILPMLPSYLHESSRSLVEWDKITYLIDHHRPKETLIYSGLGLVSHGRDESRNVEVSLMLRDRTTYRPSLSQFVIRRFDGGEEDGWDEVVRYVAHGYEAIGDQVVQPYLYCRNDKIPVEGDHYSNECLSTLKELYDELGREP